VYTEANDLEGHAFPSDDDLPHNFEEGSDMQITSLTESVEPDVDRATNVTENMESDSSGF
jgi:hypothetical protein